MNTKDLIREGTGGAPVATPAAGTTRRATRRSPYSAFALKGIRRFERSLFDRNRATYAPFRIY